METTTTVSKELISVKSWCGSNAVDLLSLVRIIKKYNLNIYKIGSEYYVESEAIIKQALSSYAKDCYVKTENRRKSAKQTASVAKKEREFLDKLVAEGKIEPADLLELGRKIKKTEEVPG